LEFLLEKQIPLFIATLLQNYLLNGGNGSSPLTPPCPFRKLPILESDWELVCNNNSPNNRHIIAILFMK
jgi:hypothetical protein